MREQLKQYIDRLFDGTVESASARDFHDELLQNTLDRFDEERAAGRSEQEAYRTAILSLGNTEDLLRPFYPKTRNTNALRAVGIILYITCVIPVILFGVMNVIPDTLGVTLMFLMIGIATVLMMLSGRARPTEEAEQARIMRAIGVGLIVSSVASVLFGAGYDQIRIWRIIPVEGAILGVCGMFCMIAAGIALLVIAGQKRRSASTPDVPVMTAEPRYGQTEPVREVPPEEIPMRPVIPKGVRIASGIMSAIYWVLVVMLYILVSARTGAWLFSWLIFVVASGVYDIVKSIVHLCCGLPWLSRFLGGILTLIGAAVYYYLTKTTGLWMITWLVFLITGCISGMINGIINLAKSSKKENAL